MGETSAAHDHPTLRRGRSNISDRSFAFAVRIVKLCRELQGASGVAYPLVNQLLRAGTSVGANIAEGQSAQSRADFIHKLSIACKEARETHYWLRLLAAAGVAPEKQLADLTDEANQLTAILTSITASAKRNAKSGSNQNSPPL